MQIFFEPNESIYEGYYCSKDETIDYGFDINEFYTLEEMKVSQDLGILE